MQLDVASELDAGRSEYVWMPQLLLLVGARLAKLELTVAESEVPFCTIRYWKERGVLLDVPRYVTSRI